MKQVIYRPEILKSKIKAELNKEIERDIKADPVLKLQYKRMTKKERYRLLKAMREQKLGGKTVQQVLQEEAEG